MNSTSTARGNRRVDRHPLYFSDHADTLFGWFHRADDADQKDCAAVICSPIGWEYVHSHRSMRHLADQLALSGIPALRFDYHGIGTSPGTDLDAERWQHWKSNIKAAMDRVSEMSGRHRICLIGVRIGATLAAQVAAELNVDLLVMWNPCISGRRYLRESQAIAATAERKTKDDHSQIESGGFVMSAETISAIRDVNLLELGFRPGVTALIIGRDDLAPDRSLHEHLTALGIANDYVISTGYAGMMAEAQFTVIPDATLRLISDWACAHSGDITHGASRPTLESLQQAVSITIPNENGVATDIAESICRFGSAGQLFGIMARPIADAGFPVVILFNAGAVHQVGPNRLYVALARCLAAHGVPSLRFDLEGIGDSVQNSGDRENHPYPDSASRDAKSALEYLKRHFAYEHFVVSGLCSGAHTAFHAGLDCDQERISDIILINPLTYHWVEGMTLDTTRHFQDVSYYRGAIRDPRRWLKFLRGQTDIAKAVGVALSQLKSIACINFHAALEKFGLGAGTPLSHGLRHLYAMKRQITLFISEDDPGLDILLAGAKRAASSGLKNGQIKLARIPRADHTFTQSESRDTLINAICRLLLDRYGDGIRALK